MSYIVQQGHFDHLIVLFGSRVMMLQLMLGMLPEMIDMILLCNDTTLPYIVIV